MLTLLAKSQIKTEFPDITFNKIRLKTEDKNKNKSHISYHKEQNLHGPKKNILQFLLLYTVPLKMATRQLVIM